LKLTRSRGRCHYLPSLRHNGIIGNLTYGSTKVAQEEKNGKNLKRDILQSAIGVPSAESSRSVRGLGKGVSGKPYPCLCNARRPRLERQLLAMKLPARELEPQQSKGKLAW